jgi:ribonuclease BN (tRNA processing enzyme)
MSRHIPRSIESDKTEEITINSKLKLKGWSRAGCQTGFILYPYKILIDAGLSSSQRFDHVFITHQHVDHVHNLPLVCSRHKPGLNNIYVPSQSKDIIFKYFRLITELSSNDAVKLTDDEICQHQNINIVGLDAGNFINISGAKSLFFESFESVVFEEKDNLIVEVMEAHHDVQSNGYGFNTIKKVIKPEYTEIIETKNVPAIKALKAQGIEMYDKNLNPEFAFFCDSTIENLTLHEEWKKYPCIVVECTGLYVSNNNTDTKDDFDQSDRNHTSLKTLKPIMLNNKDKRWILIHVSMKMSQDEIKVIENQLLEEGLNIYICKGDM